MPTFVTVAILALHGAAAFWFDPSTGRCDGGFQLCPLQPSEREECRVGSVLQCFDGKRGLEVLIPCSGEIFDKEALKGLPCRNDTSTKATVEGVQTGNFQSQNSTDDSELEGEKFDVAKFVDAAKPALIIMASIAGVILVLILLICIVARGLHARSKKIDSYHTSC
ncbi:Hypothetical predicted protein [Cloeon dipterum]|uniref:SUEL-type lectin domain-containing protein n=1 Tax=Cloeon dipterum TaxID=197152 RepID=A0A8S1BT10_9INSE|nr:Hypothetical predicted protein [Cloeon dipterum]